VLCLAGLWQGAFAANIAESAEHAAQGAAFSSARSSALANAVREAEQLRAQALARRDIGVLRRLISGDYYHVESNGRVRTKTEFLQALERNEFRLRGYGVDDVEINVLDGGSTAIVTGAYRATMQSLPANQPARGRYVRVWTRHPDGWRNALHQSTEIRPVNDAARAMGQPPAP
jgi:ketosteroid isomerase-like protein